MTEPNVLDDDTDPAIIAAARALADRVQHDRIGVAVLLQAATTRRRPDFAAALAVAIERRWIGADLDDDQRAELVDRAVATAAGPGW